MMNTSHQLFAQFEPSSLYLCCERSTKGLLQVLSEADTLDACTSNEPSYSMINI
jgi:hypothetical protein